MSSINPTLRNLTKAVSVGNQSLLEACKKTRQDSRVTRIMTAIAIVYLPLNLTASVFSTDLVRYDSIGKGVWLFVLVTSIFLVCTAAAAYTWYRKGKSEVSGGQGRPMAPAQFWPERWPQRGSSSLSRRNLQRSTWTQTAKRPGKFNTLRLIDLLFILVSN